MPVKSAVRLGSGLFSDFRVGRFLPGREKFTDKIAWGICSIKFFAYLCTTITGNTPFFADGAIAQLVEQRTENPCVAGSIPAGTTWKSTTYSNVGGFLFVFFVAVLWWFEALS